MPRLVLTAGVGLVFLLSWTTEAYCFQNSGDTVTEESVDETAQPETDKATPAIQVKAIVSKSVAKPVLTAEMIVRRDKIEHCLASYYPAHVNADILRPWSIMHGLIAFGQDTLILTGDKRIDAVDYLCANGRGNDRRILHVKNGKLQARKGDGYQGHHGQLLSMFAQSNVPIDHPIEVDGKSFTVADLVELEKKSCRTRTELTFQLIGLAHYLDPDDRWKNSQGQNWNIPRMISEEIVQPINGAACGGTHRLMGLSYAVQKRKESGKPLSGQWQRANNYIEQYHKHALKLQNKDGSFSTDWFVGLSDSGKNADKLKTTGHILEWLVFSMTPEQLQDPQIDDAVDFLAEVMVDAPKNKIGVGPRDVGPKGHALRALRLYETTVFGESSDHHKFASDENIIRDFSIAQQALAHQQKYLDRVGSREKREPVQTRYRSIFRRR